MTMTIDSLNTTPVLENNVDQTVENDENINMVNVCTNLNLLNFTYYINNFPKLKNENINRLKYYFNLIINSNININGIRIQIKNDRNLNFILSKMIFSSKDDNILDNNKKTFVTLIIVLLSYKMIGNFISKKNIFTKNIEKKIAEFSDKFVYYFNKKIDAMDKDTIVNVDKVNDIVKNILNNNYFKILKYRQTIRNNYKNFTEYNNKVNEFVMFSSFDNFKNEYRTNKDEYEYKKYFFKDCGNFLQEFYDIKF